MIFKVEWLNDAGDYGYQIIQAVDKEMAQYHLVAQLYGCKGYLVTVTRVH